MVKEVNLKGKLNGNKGKENFQIVERTLKTPRALGRMDSDILLSPFLPLSRLWPTLLSFIVGLSRPLHTVLSLSFQHIAYLYMRLIPKWSTNSLAQQITRASHHLDLLLRPYPHSFFVMLLLLQPIETVNFAPSKPSDFPSQIVPLGQWLPSSPIEVLPKLSGPNALGSTT